MKRLYAIILVAGLSTACASAGAPVPSTYTPADVKTYNASQAIEDLNAFSESVINLYDAEKISKDNIIAIRNVVIPTGALIDAYGTGATTLGQAKAFIDKAADPDKELGKIVLEYIRVLVDSYSENGSLIVAISDSLNALDAALDGLPVGEAQRLRTVLKAVVSGINQLKGVN